MRIPGCIGILLLFVSLVPLRVSAQPAVVIRNVRVFDGERDIGRRDVLLQSGVIRDVEAPGLSVPDGTAVIDGTGRTLLPGLIDAHVHLSDDAASDLRQALSFGVTTVLDMFSAGERFERIKALSSADSPDMAAARSAGVGATAPGGHPSQMGGGAFPMVANASEAASFVSRRIAEGSDYIKIIYDDVAGLGSSRPMLDRATMRALIDAAHERRVLAVVHVSTEAQARVAIESGADGLAHLFAAATAGDDFAGIVARSGAFVIPTLSIEYGMCGRPSGTLVMADSLLRPYIRPGFRAMMSVLWNTITTCEGTEAAIRSMATRGVPILVGTDAPVPGTTYGASVHRELELLVQSGLTPVQALAAATSRTARAFRLPDRGRVAPGLRADLLLVEGDPTTDILATRRIVAIWKRGVRATRQRFG